MEYHCKICDYKSDKLKHGFAQHLGNKHKISVLDYFIKYERFLIPKCKCGKNLKHISGLKFRNTCGNKECISKHCSEVFKITGNREEVKQKIRVKRIEYLKNNPHQTAWRLKDKNQSWPEKFLEDACIRNDLHEKFEIVKELSVFPYYIDFAFVNIKVAVEIDGSQHELEDRKLKDNEKDKVLNQNGWRVYRIPAKFLFSIETSDEAIGKFIIFISNFEIENSSCLGITSSKERNKIKKFLEQIGKK